MTLNDELLLRLEIDARNADYAATLDARRFDDWPGFFTEAGDYRVQSRENFERGLPLALLSLQGQGMLRDRVYGITQTIYHQPYYTRHVVGVARLLSHDAGVFAAEAHYAVFRTRPGDTSEVYQVGRYLDEWVREDGTLKLRARRCIYDSEMVLNSLIYPV